MGRQRDELMPDLRSFPAWRYVVYDLASADGIELVRVLHGARDIGLADIGLADFGLADFETEGWA